MGSFFEEDNTLLQLERNKNFLLEKSELYASGRMALLDLVLYEKTINHVQKIYVPSYYCHDVTRMLEKYLVVEIYDCNILNQIDIKNISNGSLLLLVEYFGNRCLLKDTCLNKNIKILLDKTHNPFSNYHYDFDIAYVFGSLRKIFPISDGGFLYPKITLSQKIENEEFFVEIQVAMQLKKQYLLGDLSDKSDYLKKYNNFENELNKGLCILSISEKSYQKIQYINIDNILKTKNDNLLFLYGIFRNKLDIFYNNCYFSIWVDEVDLTSIRSYFIEYNVYPIILWLSYMGDVPILNNKVLLSFHVDYRYSTEDLNKLNSLIHMALERNLL